MSAPLSDWLKSLAIAFPTAVAASVLLATPASAQNSPPANPPANTQKDTKDAAKDAAKDAKDTARDTAKDARDTAKDVQNSAKDTVKDARDTAKDVKEDAKDAAKDARDNASDAAKNARDDVRDNARDTVRDPRDVNRDPARDQSRDARDPENVRKPNPLDTVRDKRDAGANVNASFSAQGTRAADIGLWFDRDTSKGLVISDVATRGAIAKLGFREGDRIVSVNGQKITREDDFVTYLFADDARTQRIKVIVIRDGQEQVVYVEPAIFVEELSYVEHDPLETFGVIIDDRYTDRIVVLRVVPRSPAYYAGLRAGDTIVTLGNQRLANVATLIQRLTTGDAGEVALQINRGQATRTLHVDLPKFVNRTERRTSLRPNFDAVEERRENRRDRRQDLREERIEDRHDRRDDRSTTPAPRVNPTAPGVAPPRVAPPPAVAPAPAPAPAPAGSPQPRPGVFPRNR